MSALEKEQQTLKGAGAHEPQGAGRDFCSDLETWVRLCRTEKGRGEPSRQGQKHPEQRRIIGCVGGEAH